MRQTIASRGRLRAPVDSAVAGDRKVCGRQGNHDDDDDDDDDNDDEDDEDDDDDDDL